jgi:hypothetical protein
MKPIEEMTDQEFRSHVHGIIGNELGAYGLARFIRLTYPGSGDYTRDRHQWLDNASLEEIAPELKQTA